MQCQLRLHLITSTEAVHKLVYRCGIVTLTEILRESLLWAEIGGGDKLSPRWR